MKIWGGLGSGKGGNGYQEDEGGAARGVEVGWSRVGRGWDEVMR